MRLSILLFALALIPGCSHFKSDCRGGSCELTAYNPQWTSATIGNQGDISDFVREQLPGSDVTLEDITFEYEGTPSGLSAPIRAYSGRYAKQDGESGWFLLILQRKNGKWQKALVKEIPGETSASFLLLRGGTLEWRGCIACDSEGVVVEREGRIEVYYPSVDFG